MSRQLYFFDHPNRFVAGTIGQPGERSFFLQATDGAQTISVGLEKAQVQILAERVEEILEEVARRGDGEVVEDEPEDLAPLELPVEEEFRVAALGLAWDSTDHVVVIEAVSGVAGEVDEEAIFSDEDTAPDALRVRLAPEKARAFSTRARALVTAGRPLCPLCSLPLDPEGHICPRQNGYHRAIVS